MAMGNTYYRNATCSAINKVKRARYEFEPVEIRDGNDSMEIEEVLKRYDAIIVDLDARELAGPVTGYLTTYTPGNSATMVVTFYDMSGSADAVLTMTGPVAIGGSNEGAWGDLGMANIRLRCTSFTIA